MAGGEERGLCVVRCAKVRNPSGFDPLDEMGEIEERIREIA